MVVPRMSDSLLQSTQDGGRCSDGRHHSLSMKKERYWTSMVTLMLNRETLKSIQSMEESTNNGTLSILTNGRENQERENSMKNLDSTLKDHSTLFLNFQPTDTLT
jgi:hypothetical protein